MEGHSEKDLITNSEELIKCIRSLCDREAEFDEEDTSLDTMYVFNDLAMRFCLNTIALITFLPTTANLVRP